MPQNLQKNMLWKTELGDLSNPACYNNALDISGFEPGKLIDALNSMVRIRLAEEIIAGMVASGVVKCPVHLAIGQEAVAVGVAANLRKTDRVFGNHRSHSHYLSMGGDERKLFAEVLGRYTGCSHGFGGSMHLYAQDVGFYGSVPIVAGTVSMATGAAIAAKLDGKGDVALAFFGDGACEEGVVHECLNMASSMRLPMIFVIENNLFSSHLDINLRQPSDKIARFAEAARITHCTIDGNDVATILKEAKGIIAKARESNAPAMIEAITYRWCGHVGANEDIDVGLRRSRVEVQAWKKRDPVERLLQSLIESGNYTRAEYEEYVSKTSEYYKKLCTEVASDPYPPVNTLMDFVYAD